MGLSRQANPPLSCASSHLSNVTVEVLVLINNLTVGFFSIEFGKTWFRFVKTDEIASVFMVLVPSDFFLVGLRHSQIFLNLNEVEYSVNHP